MRHGQICAIAVVLGMTLTFSACMQSPETKSARFVEAGKKLLKANNPARAILEFRNAVKLTPQDAEAYYQLGLAYLAAGDLRNAVVALRRTLAINPKHQGARLRFAQLMATTNDPELLKEAKQRLDALLVDTPADPDALHVLALTELKLGDPAQAMRHFEGAVAAAPGQAAHAVVLAQAKMQQSDVAGAEQVLKKACADAPQSADAATALGRFYTAQKRYNEAEQELRRALKLEPPHVWALYTLAVTQHERGQKSDAEQTLKLLSDSSEPVLKPMYASYLFESGKHDEAIHEFERLWKREPGDRMARTRLVAAYAAANRQLEAQKLLQDALKKNPKDLDALLQRAEFFINAGKFNEADADLNQVLHLKADSPEAHFAMAALHRARRADMLERQQLNESLRLNPAFFPARLALAKSLRGADPKAALAIMEETPVHQRGLVSFVEERNWILLQAERWRDARLGIDGGLAGARTADLLLQDGILKLIEKRYPESRQALHEALEKAPEDPRILYFLVRTYVAQRQTAVAIEEMRQYAAHHPNSAPVQYFWGTLLTQSGDREEAKKAFASARALAPGYVPAYLSLAQMTLKQSNWTDARQELNAMLSKTGENSTARLWLGMLEESVGNHDAAIAAFRKVVETDPNNATALNNLAYLLAEIGNKPDEALQLAQRAKEIEPEAAQMDDTLGWVLYRKGLYAQAVQYLERSAAKEPTALHTFHLAMAYLKSGQKERARTAFRSALRLNPNAPEIKAAAAQFQ